MAFGLGCFGHTGKRKAAYPTREDALAAIVGVSQAWKIYQCQDCEQWHKAQKNNQPRGRRR